MFDRKKLEKFLDSLDIETHLPTRKTIFDMAPPTALDLKMDKYDLFRQGDYQNAGTDESPIWIPFNQDLYHFGFTGFVSGNNGTVTTVIPQMVPIWTMPASSNVMYWSGPLFSEPPTDPVNTPFGQLKLKAQKLSTVKPVKISDPHPVSSSKSPDYIGTITGWRGWEVNDRMLRAIGTDFAWHPKVAAKATCRSLNHAHHAAPQMSCGCGFWSFKTIDLMKEALSDYASSISVIGPVEIWGRVIDCENGYRSEYAYPKELWLVEEGLEYLSWEYGVPVRSM